MLEFHVDDQIYYMSWEGVTPKHFVWRNRVFTVIRPGVYECNGTVFVLDDDDLTPVE